MGGSLTPSDLELWGAPALVLACVALSAFFSGSETALTAASRARMHALERNGDRRAAEVNRLVEGRERFIGAMLLGNTLVTVGASALTTSLMLALAGDRGVLYATATMTVLILVFAEVLPKTLAINYPDQMSLLVARIVGFFVAVFGPVLIGVEALVRLLLRLVGVRIGETASVLSGHEELKSAVDLLHKEGEVGRRDRDMFGGLLDLKDLNVGDVMVHRTAMRTVDAGLPAEDLVREVIASPFTRLPVWDGTPDNIVGVVHAKDLLRALEAAGNDPARVKVTQVAAPPWFVPVTTPLGDQLQAFLKRKTHFALVVDEYGEVLGVVTLEDILEEIVGDISDEHDIVAQGVRPQADGSVVVDGSVPIRDLNRVMGWDLPDEEATTVAGLVIHEARTIPETGQKFTFHAMRFEIMRKTRNRVTALKVTPVPRPGP